MLEADDSERACIPAKLQLTNFCQFLPVTKGRNRPEADSNDESSNGERTFAIETLDTNAKAITEAIMRLRQS